MRSAVPSCPRAQLLHSELHSRVCSSLDRVSVRTAWGLILAVCAAFWIGFGALLAALLG